MVAVDDVLAAIRLSAQQDLERLSVITDAAVLAAEQVQDVRLDLLEQGPKVTTSDLIFDALLTFALESPIAGLAAKALTQAIVRPIVLKVGRASVMRASQ